MKKTAQKRLYFTVKVKARQVYAGYDKSAAMRQIMQNRETTVTTEVVNSSAVNPNVRSTQ